MTELVTRPNVTVSLDTLAEQARRYALASKADNTWKAYRLDWDAFTDWCQRRGLDALPATPTTVALYLTEQAPHLKVATLGRRLSSIAQAHKTAGHLTPTTAAEVQLTWDGIKRQAAKDGQTVRAVAPATIGVIRAMVAELDGSLLAIRDRAVLLLGFAGAFRRSELVSLDVNDVELVDEGLRVTVRRSKTDQEGAGRTVGILYGAKLATCPVRAWQAWLGASAVTDGAAFRGINRHGQVSAKRLTDKAVALVVKRRAEAAGLDPEQFSGHSLRAGLATTSAAAGHSERTIMKQTGHTSLPTVRRYIRDGELFTDNATEGIGL